MWHHLWWLTPVRLHWVKSVFHTAKSHCLSKISWTCIGLPHGSRMLLLAETQRVQVFSRLSRKDLLADAAALNQGTAPQYIRQLERHIMAGSEWIEIGHLLGQNILAGVDYGLYLERIVFVESQVFVFRFLCRISLCWPPHSTIMMM